MRNLTILLMALYVSACSLLPSRPEAVTVKVPVAVPCVIEIPARPAFASDDEYQAMDEYRFVTSLWLERRQRQNYEGELEAVLEGCK